MKGRVIDSETSEPIKGVNVYLLGTLKGTTTDNHGLFIITNIPESTFYIVASHIAYKSQKYKIKSDKYDNVELNFVLEQTVLELPEVYVNSSTTEWELNYKLFQVQFIGALRNSNFTTILNPYILNFSLSKQGWLQADADEAILVRNEILGYKIKYFLDVFESDGLSVKYSGHPFFQDISDSVDKDSTTKNERIKAYCGSLRHFLYTAISQLEEENILKNLNKFTISKNDTNILALEKHGFKVFTQNILADNGVVNPIIYPAEIRKIIKKCPQSSRYYLKFSNYLRIEYNREFEDKQYVKLTRPNNIEIMKPVQTSIITLDTDSVFIDMSGYSIDLLNIHTYGYFAYERLANMLPYEYFLKDSISENYNLYID